MKRLGLVKTIVIATSMRADAKMPPADASSDEPFSEFAAALTLANGTAHTTDLRFESPDVHMRAAGSLRLDGSAIDLRGDVQLSDTLSQQAGRDLLRYTQDQDESRCLSASPARRRRRRCASTSPVSPVGR